MTWIYTQLAQQKKLLSDNGKDIVVKKVIDVLEIFMAIDDD